MDWRLRKCDHEGLIAVSIQGFLLNRNGDKDFINPDQFADSVLKARPVG